MTIPAASVSVAAADSVPNSDLSLPHRHPDSLPIYLDYNATTPLSDRVIEAMRPFMTAGPGFNGVGDDSPLHPTPGPATPLFGNASSSHRYGVAAKQQLETARRHIAQSIHAADPMEILFTSGATESLNSALIGGALAQRRRIMGKDVRSGGHIITQATEHVAALNIVSYLREEHGFDVTILPVDHEGLVDPIAVQSALRDDTLLVSVMLANNEVGTIQPLPVIASTIRSWLSSHSYSSDRILLHTDASQAMGKLRVDVEELGVDLLTIAGHKLYAPKGIGALYIRQSSVGKHGGLAKIMIGANHESNRRAGTENVMYAAALGAACQDATTNIQTIMQHMQQRRDELYDSISSNLRRLLKVHGLDSIMHVPELDAAVARPPDSAYVVFPSSTVSADVPASSSSASVSPLPSTPAAFEVYVSLSHRLVNTLSIGFWRLPASHLLQRLSQHVAASAGAACHSASDVKLSYVLRALCVREEYGMGVIRLTVGRQTTSKEARTAGEWIAKVAVTMWQEQQQQQQR